MGVQRQRLRRTARKSPEGRYREVDIRRLQAYIRRAFLGVAGDRGWLPRPADLRVQRVHSGRDISKLRNVKYKYAAKRHAREQVAVLTEAPPCELLDRVLQAESFFVLREGLLRDSP